MDQISIGDREITVKELNVDDVKNIDIDTLKNVNKILEAWQSWSKSGFELIIAKPNVFLGLLCKSTGQKKKFIKKLKAREFDSLAFVFLSVNAEFFIQRIRLIEMAR